MAEEAYVIVVGTDAPMDPDVAMLDAIGRAAIAASTLRRSKAWVGEPLREQQYQIVRAAIEKAYEMGQTNVRENELYPAGRRNANLLAAVDERNRLLGDLTNLYEAYGGTRLLQLLQKYNVQVA